MIGRRRGTIGVVLLLVATSIAVGWLVSDDDDLLVVRGAVGSEKAGFLDSPAVTEILADRYGLRVDYLAAGSLAILESGPGGHDFLWPASPIADETRFDPVPMSEEVFYSPIVLYSWSAVTDALIAAGLVQQIDGTYYVTDFPRLVELIDGGVAWSELGLPQVPSPIAITTTDPTTSNSGNSFAGLLANTYNGGQVVDEATIDVLGAVQAYYARFGGLEQSSGFLFQEFVAQGMVAFPIIAGYESSLIEYLLESGESLDEIRDEIRLLYPRPTVWSSHPLIALTPAGEQLLAALRDEEIQRLAWERHGFRTGLFGIENDPTALNLVGVPLTIDSVMPLPRASVMKRIVEPLRVDLPGAADTSGLVPTLRSARLSSGRGVARRVKRLPIGQGSGRATSPAPIIEGFSANRRTTR